MLPHSLMISLVLLLGLSGVSPAMPLIREPRELAVVADTARPKPKPADRGRDRGKPPSSEPGKTSRDPRGRDHPETGRGKPLAPQPTGDPRLKRRKPPQLHSPRKPDDDAGA